MRVIEERGNMDIKELTLDEVEDLVIGGDAEAINELSRRYREGDGVEKDTVMAEGLLAQIGETVDDSEVNTSDSVEESDEQRTSWKKQYDTMKCEIVGLLREKARSGDTTALIVLAEKYLESANPAEIETGLNMLDKAEKMLLEEMSSDKSSCSREALVYLLTLKGEKLEEQYERVHKEFLEKKEDIEENNGQVYYDFDEFFEASERADEKAYALEREFEIATSDLGQQIFDAYSNAYELDPTQIEGIAHCYRMGIGVEPDVFKARQYEEKLAISGGIEERYKIGLDAYASGEMIRATEWLQNALLSGDASKHDVLRHCSRIMLAKMGASDNQGNPINERSELDQLLYLAQSHGDSEAAYYLAYFEENDEDKIQYYEMGAKGTPDKYASMCLKKIEQIRLEAEKRRIAEEELEKTKKQQEIEAEKKRQQERQQEAKAEKERRQKNLEKAFKLHNLPNVVVILSILFFPPLGLFLEITSNRWYVAVKILATPFILYWTWLWAHYYHIL